MSGVLWRIFAGFATAAAIALAARRHGSLSDSGAGAATVLGAVVAAAGWDWGALLIMFFSTSTLLSRWRQEGKQARTAGMVAKSGRRDAWQVAANGGVFGLCAVGALASPHALWLAAGAGAIAAAAADTWSTEVGTAVGSTPRSLTTWQLVPAGTSGGVSAAGTAAALAGAIVIGGVVLLVGWPLAAGAAAVAGGLGGAMLDSLVGATVQSRRWCARCSAETERAVHHCGAATTVTRGLGWLDNDGVNLCCTVGGAVVGTLTAVAWPAR